jgi:hypothetical protein
LYIRNRVLCPHLGLWITRDPLGHASGDRNFYCYVGDRPVVTIDPFGLFGAGPVIVIVIAVIIILGVRVLIVRRYVGVRTRRLSPDEFGRAQFIRKGLQDCAYRVGNRRVANNLETMELAGALDSTDPEALRLDANAYTVFTRTYLTDAFLKKTPCQQAATLLHESERVGGNYSDEDDAEALNRLSAREAKEFFEMACCLGCCDDLPPGLPNKWRKLGPKGCCCDPSGKDSKSVELDR